jgi:L-lactate dehydrogenase complex protein LldG
MTKSFILDKLKAQINPSLSDETRRMAVADRLTKHARGVLPAMPATRIKRVNKFIEKVIASQATIEQISKRNASQAISEYLRSHNLLGEIRMGKDERLKIIRDDAKGLLIKDGRSDGQDLASFSHAEAGVVETGTLALFSGPDNPTTLNFLPENHIVMISENDIVPHYEDVWKVVRSRYGEGQMPRTLNFITGPSRSADIEQTLLLGAHGPIRLHVLLTRD